MKGFDINPGTIGRIHQQVAGEFSNFERLKNREDSSEFDDFLTKSIATTQTFFSKIFAPRKKIASSKKPLSMPYPTTLRICRVPYPTQRPYPTVSPGLPFKVRPEDAYAKKCEENCMSQQVPQNYKKVISNSLIYNSFICN